MVELHPVVADPRPAELRLLQPFRVEADPGSIPPDDLDPVGPLGPEDIERAVERIIAGIAHQRQQTVRPFAEVNGMAGEEDLYTCGDYAERTARITRCR